MAHPLAKDDRALSDWYVLLALVIAVVVVVGAYYVVFAPVPIKALKTAQQGDSVYIDYIGYFANDNLVFDTSLQHVAADNATYPKAYSFSWRSSYTNLQFTIGDGSVIKGFDDGARGLALGQTTTVSVPYSQGYGPANPSLISVHNLVETVAVRQTMNASAFFSYYGENPVSATNVTDPVYGWSVTVSILNGVITTTNSPYPGEVVHPYQAWAADILGIDDTANNGTGLITIQNHLDPTMIDKVGAKAPNGQTFYLSAVDAVAGTYTLNFNKQVVGRTLVFQITLVRLVSNV
jgi:FKBP-type peptidyl-prolyl cis-trans isomerase 2